MFIVSIICNYSISRYNQWIFNFYKIRAVQALDMLVKPKQDNEINNKLEKLRILLPEKTDEQLLALLEILN